LPDAQWGRIVQRHTTLGDRMTDQELFEGVGRPLTPRQDRIEAEIEMSVRWCTARYYRAD
jgi:hypothetical protein